MNHHLVLGAGAIGTGIARTLAARGEEVVLASRSGVDAPPAGVHGARVDATDPDSLAAAARGAASIVNALNPAQYHRWARDWPPMAAAILEAAERTGAGLVTVSNLYGYGPVTAPMTEQTPLAATGLKGSIRAGMWREALQRHDQGRIRATELRASDYFGADARPMTSVLNTFVIAPAAGGRTVRPFGGDPDAPHSWTYLPDVYALGAALAVSDAAWGRAWHVPTGPARSMRQVAADAAALTGARAPRIRVVPAAVRTLTRVAPLVRALEETRYQFDRPFELDSRAAQETFGLAPTPWERALAETVASLTPAEEAGAAQRS